MSCTPMINVADVEASSRWYLWVRDPDGYTIALCGAADWAS